MRVSIPVPIALIAAVALAVLTVASTADAHPCGSYPNCNEGNLCENGDTYVCQKKDNKCGPWSKSSGCPKATAAGAEAAPPAAMASPTRECLGRKGGAVIGFEVNKETLAVWTTNGKFIDEAIAFKDKGTSKLPMFKKLLDKRDCDAQWSWHTDPEAVEFVQTAIELCDGLPSHVEKNKSEWLNSVKRYCPWKAKVVSVDDRRQPRPAEKAQPMSKKAKALADSLMKASKDDVRAAMSRLAYDPGTTMCSCPASGSEPACNVICWCADTQYAHCTCGGQNGGNACRCDRGCTGGAP